MVLYQGWNNRVRGESRRLDSLSGLETLEMRTLREHKAANRI